MSRYHRQMLLPGFGAEGQETLSNAHALIVGCGALGCVAADLLTRAGTGMLTIVDRDIVEQTNLQRQVLFDEQDAEQHRPKALAAKRRLEAVNSEINIRALVTDFCASTAERIITGNGASRPTVILDGTDNFETRYLINDVAVKYRIPLVYAGVVGTSAMAMSILPDEPQCPCLRCIFPDLPEPGSQPTCETAGVLGPVVSIVAGYQCVEALKILIGRPDLVNRSLLSFDPWVGARTRLDLNGARDAACPCCGHQVFKFLDRDSLEPVVSLCGKGAVQITPAAFSELDLQSLKRRLDTVGSFHAGEMVLFGSLTEERDDAGESIGLTVFPDGRAQIRGLSSPERARAIYDRYIGA